MYYLCTSEEERALNTGFFPLFLPHIKEEKHRKLEILYAFADFLNAFADFLNAFADFLNAFAVREMTM